MSAQPYPLNLVTLPQAFQTASALLGVLFTLIGVRGLAKPVQFATDFGLPIPPEHSSKATTSSVPSLENDSKSTQDPPMASRGQPSTFSSITPPHPSPIIIPLAGRNLFLGLSTLSLTFIKAEKELATLWIVMSLTAGLTDTVSCVLYGTKGTGWSHGIAMGLMATVGIAGILSNS